MKWIILVSKNMMTNRRRSLLTMGAIALALFMYLSLQTVNDALEVDVTKSDRDGRLAVLDQSGDMHNLLPISYLGKLTHIEGVSSVCPASLTVLAPGNEQSKNYLALAVEPEAFRKVYRKPMENVPAEQYERFMETQNGMLVGRDIMERSGWRVGDIVRLNSIMIKRDLDLTICGVYTDLNGANKQMESQIFLHYAYYDESSGRTGKTNFFWLKVEGQDLEQRVMLNVAQELADAPQQIVVETESSMLSRLNQLTETLRQVITAVSLMVMGVVLVVVVNAIALSMRERRREIAVMKAIGFAPTRILGLVLGEAVLLSLIAGAVGTLVAFALFATAKLSITTVLTFNFVVSPKAVLQGLVISLLLGTLGGLIPAWQASRVRVVAALRSL